MSFKRPVLDDTLLRINGHQYLCTKWVYGEEKTAVCVNDNVGIPKSDVGGQLSVVNMPPSQFLAAVATCHPNEFEYL
jgi:hypothetical protein